MRPRTVPNHERWPENLSTTVPAPDASVKGVRVVAHEDGADALIGSRHEDGTKRAFSDGETYLDVAAAIPVCRGSHTQHLVRGFVEPPARIEPCVIKRLCHCRAGLCKRLPDTLGAMRDSISP